MPFPVGSAVVVLALGKKRGVVVQTGRGGRYLVRIDNATVSCFERDLQIPPDDRARRKSRRRPDAEASDAELRQDGERGARGEPRTASAGRVDLHGLTVDEAIARVLHEIDHALRRGADRVEVVHGKGSGRIREAVHRELAGVPAVASFRLDPQNPGVTWVYL